MNQALQDRIAKRVQPQSECLVWQGATDKDGYGQIQVDGRLQKVHRVMWFVSHGPIPKGMVVRHVVCDNPPCCRVDHLALGTNADNSADMVRRGRQNSPRGDRHGLRLHPEAAPRGEHNGHAKLTDLQVEEIRRAYETGMRTQKQIAAEFGIGQSQVGRIVRGESRTHRWLRRPA